MSVAVGAELTPWVLDSVSADAMRELAVIFDDPNPIHIDPDAVRRLGMGDRVVNQGPANWGYILTMLAAAFPGSVVADLEFRFRAPVHAGDRVVAAGRVEAVDGQRVRCRVWLDVDGGARAVEGVATLLV